MRRPFLLVLSLAAILVVSGLSTGEARAAKSEATSSVVEAIPWVAPPHIGTGAREQRREEDSREAEAPQPVDPWEAKAMEAAVWLHLLEEMRSSRGVLVLAELPGREFVPVWAERPQRSFRGQFEVAVELSAVSLLPSDFPSIDEASLAPGEVPRSVELATRLRAMVRPPASWQVTFDLREAGDGDYRIVGWRITGRPGQARRPIG